MDPSASSPPPDAASPNSAPGPEGVRERIFQVALARIRRDGYDEVPVSHITRQAGVAKGTFFNHFPRKETVLAEAFHRIVNEALGEVAGARLVGTEAIVTFASVLAGRLAGDPPLAAAILPRLSVLPPADPGEPREEARIREWAEARLAETLPTSVPLEEVDDRTLAFLVAATIRTTLEEWMRPEGPARPLPELLLDRLRFLLRSAGLPCPDPTVF